jgi:cytidyltransferase-like protein
MKRVMISGHFDGLHAGHLDYFKQAIKAGENIICVVSTDKQLLMKKGKINLPANERLEIVDYVLKGLTRSYCGLSITMLNLFDDKDASVAEALRSIRPDIFLRGYDKTLKTMSQNEKRVCDELGIKIVHAENRIGERHSSEVFK